MEELRRSITGSICSFATGIVLLILVVAYFFTPVDQASTTTVYSHAYFASINKTFIVQEILYWALVLSAVFGVGVVVVVTSRIRDDNKELVTWTSVLAYIGFGIQILCNVLGREYVLKIAPHYADFEPGVQALINVQSNFFNDWAAFGFVGSWFVAANIYGFRTPWYPNFLAIAGFIAGIGYWLIPLGNLLHLDIFISIAAGIAVVLAPLWYFGMGAVLLGKRFGRKKQA